MSNDILQVPIPDEQLVLHRFAIKPHHLDDYLPLWRREAEIARWHGFTTHRAFLETNAEPKLTWLYSHPDPEAGNRAVRADPETIRVEALKAPHVFRNVKIRPVRGEYLTHLDTTVTPHPLAVMRRYSIVGSWSEFLDVWQRIRVVREIYGFGCLFAVVDEPENMFTWAFEYDGEWRDFATAQLEYYHDPDRIALRGVFDYMADYSINPAQQLM